MEETKENVEGGRFTDSKATVLESLKPYLLCIFVSFCQAGYNIISKVCLDKGMSLYVLTAYGYAFATVITAVLALLFESRKNESKLSPLVCLNILFVAVLEVLARILFYTGLEYTSAAFAAALNNLSPSMTILLAILCRMEKLNLFKLNGQAKIGGTIIAFGGATLMTLYKGITVLSFHSHYTHQNAKSKVLSEEHFVKGSVLLVLQSLTLGAFFILQTKSVKKYPAPITLTSLTNLAGTLIAATLAGIVDHKASSWRLSWDITLVAPLYSGIVMFAITFFVQTMVIQKKGPVFTTAFRPLSTAIAAIMGLLILGEAVHLGGIIGAMLIILGLYAILWGKKDEKNKRFLESTKSEQDQVLEIKAEK